MRERHSTSDCIEEVSDLVARNVLLVKLNRVRGLRNRRTVRGPMMRFVASRCTVPTRRILCPPSVMDMTDPTSEGGFDGVVTASGQQHCLAHAKIERSFDPVMGNSREVQCRTCA